MGRGRAKAKQTKVARELKYNTPTTDLDALERELSSDVPQEHKSWYDDPYADPYDYDPYAVDEVDGGEDGHRR